MNQQNWISTSSQFRPASIRFTTIKRIPHLCTKMHLLYVLGDTFCQIHWCLSVCIARRYADMIKTVLSCETQNQHFLRKLQKMGRKPSRSLMRDRKTRHVFGRNSFTICTSHKQSRMIHNKGALLLFVFMEVPKVLFSPAPQQNQQS